MRIKLNYSMTMQQNDVYRTFLINQKYLIERIVDVILVRSNSDYIGSLKSFWRCQSQFYTFNKQLMISYFSKGITVSLNLQYVCVLGEWFCTKHSILISVPSNAPINLWGTRTFGPEESDEKENIKIKKYLFPIQCYEKLLVTL